MQVWDEVAGQEIGNFCLVFGLQLDRNFQRQLQQLAVQLDLAMPFLRTV